MEQDKKRQEHNAPRKRKRRRFGIVGAFFKLLGTLMLIGICTGVMFLWIFKNYVDTTLTPTLQVRAEDYTMQLSSVIYYQDRDTQEWKEYETIYYEENRIWVDIEDMPDMLWKAAVAIEDERFFQHEGVDWKRTAGAVLKFFGDGSNTYGGSTITQQMLKNMTQDNDGTVNRKIREIFRALEFEKNYEKMQILELYLNTIYLGQGCYGVQTAAEFYFGKEVSDLSAAECASLIAITNNPSIYGPMSTVKLTNSEKGTVTTAREMNKRRQEDILWKMMDPETGLCYLTEEEYEAACDEVLYFTDGTTSVDELVKAATGGVKINDWFVEQVIWDVSRDLAEQEGITEAEARIKLYSSGYHIYTTIDPKIQRIAESVYEDRSNLDLTSKDGQPIRSGITIIDPATGNIVAIVGDMGEKSGNLITSYATDRRQVGSSIKPLTVYAPAIDNGSVTSITTFDDYPIQLLEDKPWPRNSPTIYRGMVSVATGIQHSINTVSLQTLMAGGITDAYAFATEGLGLNLAPEDMNLSAMGLGGLHYGLNTVEMAAAYASFANQGVYNEPRTYLKVMNADETVTVLENVGESRVAMQENTACQMTDMLQTAVKYGTGTQAVFKGMPIAGKTGTTSNNCDRYFVGYTPYYCAAVWTGYRLSAKITYPEGNPSITLWKLVMEKIHEELEYKDFPTLDPDLLETVDICLDSGLLATETCEADMRGSRKATVKVMEGTAPTEECGMHTYIDYCEEGQCIATELCVDPVQKSVLNIVREEYGLDIVAQDDLYTVGGLEKAIGLRPALDFEMDEKGEKRTGEVTEVYPEVIGCPVHQEESDIPDWWPEDWGDWEGWGDWGDWGDDDPTGDPEDPEAEPGEGRLPEEPGEPADPDAEEDAWWRDLVNRLH